MAIEEKETNIAMEYWKSPLLLRFFKNKILPLGRIQFSGNIVLSVVSLESEELKLI